ncbi:uncharacterized protein B0J16DRAFT_391042 [Fusarium flagelliforme]|uniref:uncharacterized protein n=1 Tax=Fusarium flagelliforme TaxID=2675880 RepID=UPI001E8EC6AC|nr:uncharacterized protein B0J16DRAFT_391042 [Fusarium flagelliforme]KAH7197266.1 hypothetical protein B0J16DRAFT_391042 [Fusarium flagelliforme]
METTKMGTTKKSATKPNKRVWVGGTYRMTKPSLSNKLKMRVIEGMAPKRIIPRMAISRVAKEIISHLPGATVDDPNRLSLAAVETLHTAAEGFLADVLSSSYVLARHANRTTLMDSDIKCICTVMRTLNKTTFGDDGFHAKLKGVLADTETQAGSANDGTDSDDTNSEASQSMTADNGMNDALQSNEAPAAHDNATSECNLMDGDNHRTKRRMVILRVRPRNSHAAI